MNDKRLMKLLEKCGAVRHGHFKYSAGDHGKVYVAKERFAKNPRNASEACREYAKRIAKYCNLHDITEVTIVGAVAGGVGLSLLTALYLSTHQMKVTSVFADKVAGKKGEFVISRGFEEDITDKQCVIVEDIINTGMTTCGVRSAVEALGGKVVMVMALVNRTRQSAESLGVPHLDVILEINLAKYSPDECPLCKEGVPIDTSFGHGGRDIQAQAQQQQ